MIVMQRCSEVNSNGTEFTATDPIAKCLNSSETLILTTSNSYLGSIRLNLMRWHERTLPLRTASVSASCNIAVAYGDLLTSESVSACKFAGFFMLLPTLGWSGDGNKLCEICL